MFTTDSFECRDCGRIFEVQKLMDHLVHLQSVVDNQANDEGLWVIARYASEAYIQKGIRTLHHEIEEFEL